jgi:WD40 repeat protein
MGRLIAKTGAEGTHTSQGTSIFSLCPLWDLGILVVGDLDGGVRWIDLNHPEKTKNILHHRKGTYGIINIENNIFTIGGDGVLTRWNKHLQRAEESIHISKQALRSIDYCPLKNEIAVGSSDGNVYLFDSALNNQGKTWQAHTNSVFCVRYSPHKDARYLLTGGRDAMLNIWQPSEKGYNLISSQAAHLSTINDLVFNSSGQYFATASRDKTIKIWETNTWKLLKVINNTRNGGHLNSVNRLLWLEDVLISVSDDRSIIQWEI